MANVYRSSRSEVGLLLAVLLLVTIPGCSTIQPADNAACITDADCSDGEFCSGEANRCELYCVADVGCIDGDPCTDDLCEGGICRHSEIPACRPLPSCTTDADCNDGTFCNGAETCNTGGRCLEGTDLCLGQLCREAERMCVDCLEDDDCHDGMFCNGTETCEADGTCQSGVDPCAVTQVCDEAADLCAACTSITDCPEGQGCVLPTYSVDVAECDVPFCPPAVRVIQAVNEEGNPGLECAGWGGSNTCQGNSHYQAFQYKSEDVFLYVSFDPEIAGNYSNEAFREHFRHIWMNIYFPPHPSDKSTFYHQTQAIRSIDFLDEFRYEDGRLYVSLTFDIPSVSQEVFSMDPDCLSGDILGWCYCSYRDLVIPTHIEFDLSVEGS